ncbi:type IV pilus assembly protein PilM [Candidatus Kaiserbacteria bacterium]|nr:type IV pilus assembly protein PilM [Candidatus Kaiserbacteria bacterium]
MAFNLSNIVRVFSGKKTHTPRGAVMGVDIGSSAIKVVQLHMEKGVPTLDTYGEMQLAPYAGMDIGRTVSLPVDKLIEAFVDIVRESSVTSTDVALAISYSASFATIVPIPTTNPEEISSRISVEARKYIPVPLNEVTLDWFPVVTRAETSETKILLAAIYTDVLNKYETIIRGSKLNLRLNEIEVFSLIRSSVSQKDDVVAVVDLGAGSTKIYIAHKGVLVQTHSLRMSGTELTSTIAGAAGVDFKMAERLKREYGLGVYPEYPSVQKLLAATVERGFQELHKVMMRFSEEEHLRVDKVILSGNGALTKGITRFAQDILQVPAVNATPFSKVAYPAFLEDTLTEAGPAFAVAIGAALRALMQENS